MKTKIFTTLFLVLATFWYVEAQVIDVVGKGAYNSPTTVLNIDDVSTIDSIVVEAVYKSADAVSGPVEIMTDSETKNVDATYVEGVYTNNGSDYGAHPYYFRTTVNPTSTITLNTLNNMAGVHSFVAYVYRTLQATDHYSAMNDDHGFFFRNGQYAQATFDIPILPATEPRDVTTTVVISELDFDNRLAVITVTAGDQSQTITLNEPNSGANLSMAPVTIADVAADVENIQVSIYSPRTWGEGDSFISGNIVADVEAMLDPCLNNPVGVELGDDQTVYYGYNPMAHATLTADAFDGTAPYTYLWSTGETTESICVGPDQDTAYTVTVTDANGCVATDNVTVNVVDVRCGWNGHRVKVCHTSFWCPNIQYTVCVRKWMVHWLLCWGDQIGDCDLYKSAPLLGEIPEFESEADLRAFDQKFFEEYKAGNPGLSSAEINVYPNPVQNYANIEFAVENNNQTSIEVFSMMGQKVASLYNEKAVAGQKYNVAFDASGLSSGVYFVILRNGDNTMKQKITIK